MQICKQRFSYVLIVTINLLALSVSAQKEDYVQSLNRKNHWVDSVFKKMNRKKN